MKLARMQVVSDGAGSEGGPPWDSSHRGGAATVDEPWPSSSGPLITLPSGEPLPVAPDGSLPHLPHNDTAERCALCSAWC